MRRAVRYPLVSVVLLASVILVWEFQGFLYPEAFARWRANRIMEAHCSQWHMDTNSLAGPVRQQSPLGTWEFRWTYSDKQHAEKDIIQISLRWDGSSDLDGERVE